MASDPMSPFDKAVKAGVGAHPDNDHVSCPFCGRPTKSSLRRERALRSWETRRKNERERLKKGQTGT
jgi:hypothetical protein